MKSIRNSRLCVMLTILKHCFVEMLRVDYVNDPRIIAKQPKMTAINSCIEVDLTGQISSDSIGTRMYSGFGGQVDFISGAAMSEDHLGKPIIALRSTTNKGATKIVPTLNLGTFFHDNIY